VQQEGQSKNLNPQAETLPEAVGQGGRLQGQGDEKKLGGTGGHVGTVYCPVLKTHVGVTKKSQEEIVCTGNPMNGKKGTSGT